MAHSYYNQSGLEIKPDGPFYSDLLFDYLSTTPYKWKTNFNRTYFLIDDFEYSESELLQRLGEELETNNIQAEFNTSDDYE